MTFSVAPHKSRGGAGKGKRMLPDDVCDLILRHKAALCIQRSWTRFSLFSHARRERWGELKEYLVEQGVWSSIWRYAMVRREWRQEPESWRGASREVLHTIRDEAQSHHLWGAPWGGWSAGKSL